MRKADNLPPSCAVVMKSENLNFLEPSGPLQACNGTAFYQQMCNLLEIYSYMYLLHGRCITSNYEADLFKYVITYFTWARMAQSVQ